MPPLLPTAVHDGDEVAVLAPASAVRDAAAFERGLERLRGWGLQPIVMPNVPAAGGGLDWPEGSTLAADDDARLADLQLALDDARYRAIFCARGGYGAARLLDRLDWSRFATSPKAIVGYSDITALLCAARAATGADACVGLHGPMVATTDAMEPGDDNWQLQRSLLQEHDEPPPLPPPTQPPRALRVGRAEGPLVGGNLAIVQSLLGTRWQLDADGCLLFLEDIGEAPYRVDRMLTQLRQAGVLQRAAGIVLGDFHVDGTPLASVHAPMQAVLEERLAGLELPIACGFPFGHRPGSWTLPFGTRARLTAPDDGAPATLALLGPSTR